MSTTTASLGGGGITLVVLASFCWLLMIVNLAGIAGREVHGDAVVGQAFQWIAASVLAFLTWLWLGGLLLKAATESRMPGWASAASLIFFIASAAAGLAAFVLMQNPRVVWPIAIPAVVPPILIVYVFALYFAPLKPIASASSGSAFVWGVVAILSIAPLPALYLKLTSDRVSKLEQAKVEEWKVQERARVRAENLEKLRAMTPDVPLHEYLPLLQDDSGVRDEALEAVRKLDHRQSDAEDVLRWGLAGAMRLLPDLDLEATPELCSAANAFMLKAAKESRVRPKQDPRVYAAGGDFDASTGAIRWLATHGCNCDASIDAFEASISSHLDSPDRQAALATIAELRAKK